MQMKLFHFHIVFNPIRSASTDVRIKKMKAADKVSKRSKKENPREVVLREIAERDGSTGSKSGIFHHFKS